MDASVPRLEEAIIVRLAVPAGDQEGGLASLRVLAAQVPVATQLERGTLVAIPEADHEPSRRGLWKRLVARPAPSLVRAARCTALLARGYVDISAGKDASGLDWVWGYAP